MAPRENSAVILRQPSSQAAAERSRGASPKLSDAAGELRCEQTISRVLSRPRLCLPKLLLVLLAGWHLWTAPVSAQVSREYQLKAVLLLRLAQFTQWPADAFETPESPIQICVLGENPFGDSLSAAVAGETSHGRPLVAQHHRAVEQIKGCHVLYLTGAGPRQAKAILAVVAGRSILSVRDLEGLPSAYDTIVKFVTEQNRIKLIISVKAAAAARLVLDPRLLRVAEVVGE